MEKRVKESQSCSTNPSGSGPLSASDKANLIPAEADESELDEPSIADDILSLFGGNDYDEIDTTDNEIDLLDLINESLNPSDVTGPPVSEMDGEHQYYTWTSNTKLLDGILESQGCLL